MATFLHVELYQKKVTRLQRRTILMIQKELLQVRKRTFLYLP